MGTRASIEFYLCAFHVGKWAPDESIEDAYHRALNISDDQQTYDGSALQEKHANAVDRMYEVAGLNVKTATQSEFAALRLRLLDEARKAGMRFPGSAEETGDGRQRGYVERIVPGRLVYVAFSSEVKSTPFRLDKLLIKQSDGTFSSYAGEPFSELGLTVGSWVEVVRVRGQQSALVFDPFDKRRRAHPGMRFPG